MASAQSHLRKFEIDAEIALHQHKITQLSGKAVLAEHEQLQITQAQAEIARLQAYYTTL